MTLSDRQRDAVESVAQSALMAACRHADAAVTRGWQLPAHSPYYFANRLETMHVIDDLLGTETDDKITALLTEASRLPVGS